ncbi:MULTISPECIES: hypothetical protein [Methylosinus]|uniref:Uncharacterized protein n=1 Tax=Methylosinus trichosporium (strain ATCC 35070 / NCIMB 11131 / UNIQEM 75 / OB3b) TaxID=595536 RepID=A0A2D2D2H1_METT3|nr:MULTISPECIES: hypothetical protein [Methylosinus]ATQ69193.1 hypothetical protein CQW49_15870 [Methylosinus trichosporium OB3b]OBS53615.1 hypothetical protein A8B73_05320 [Methylosinus sp. 3S-1]
MSEALPVAIIAHQMEGRTRLRLAQRRGDETFFADVASKLAGLDGVSRAEPAALTGGLLIFHDGPLADIGAAAQTAGLFRLEGERPQIAEPAAPKPSPRAVAALALAAAALWQIRKEKLFPSALTLAWRAAALAGFRFALGDDWGVDE